MFMLPPVHRRRRGLHLTALALALGLAACNSGTPQSLVASGKDLSAKNDQAGAVIQYKAALQLDPESVEARVLLGKALLVTGDPAGAEIELFRALSAKVPAQDVVPSLAKALVQLGEYKKLVLTYGSLVLAGQAQAELQTQLAAAWNALGDRTKTEGAVVAALKAAPEYGPARLLNARLLAGRGQFDEAAALVDDVLKSDDNFQEAWLLRGDLSNVKGDTRGAENAYRKALAIERTFVAAHAAIVSLLQKKGDIAGAKQQADQLRLVAPVHPLTTLVDARVAYLDGDLPRARELAQKLLLAFPNHQASLLLAGAVHAQMGAVVQAAALFGKALALTPSLRTARENLADAQIRLGQYAKALQTLKPLLSGDLSTARALSLAGQAEMRMGSADLAEKHFLAAAKLDPSNTQLQTTVLLYRMATGDTTAALSELQSLADTATDTYADEAIFAARLKRREYDAALLVLEGIAKKQPGKARHLEMRGRVFLARRDFASARQAFEQAVKVDPGLFAAISALVSLDLYEKKPSQAIDRLQAILVSNPQDSMSLMALAELKSHNGAPLSDVKKLLSDAVRASPSMPEPRLRQIELAMRKRQFKDAMAYAQEALATLPGDVQILEAAGLAQMQAGDLEQAASTFSKLAAALPQSGGPYMRLAEVYTAQGKASAAESAINKALELEPDNTGAQATLVDLLIASNRKRSASEYVRRIKEARPKQPFGYALEAVYFVRIKDIDAAAATLREGLTKTGSSELAGKLFSLLLQAGRTDEAVKFGNAWMKQHPTDAAFEYLQSVLDITRGDLRMAEERLKRVLLAYPKNTLALNNMAWVLVSIGGAGAVEYAQRAVDLLPDRPALMDTLALALAAERQFGPALEVQKRAIELAPNDNQLRLNLAKLAVQAGDKLLARAELQRLQSLGSAFQGQAEVTKLMQGL